MVYGKESVTEVTRERWFSRIGKAFCGIGTGLMLIVVATCLLYWNEGRSVRTGDTIAEARRATVNLPDATQRDPAFDGQTIHVTGRAFTEEEVTDPLFGIKAAAIALRRRVEFYQWVEEATQEKRTKLGGMRKPSLPIPIPHNGLAVLWIPRGSGRLTDMKIGSASGPVTRHCMRTMSRWGRTGCRSSFKEHLTRKKHSMTAACRYRQAR